MKQAKVDAQELVEGYRMEKQEEFNTTALAAGGSGGSASAKLQGETDSDIQMMQGQFQRSHIQNDLQRQVQFSSLMKIHL